MSQENGLETFYINGKNFKFCINKSNGPVSVIEDRNQRWRSIFHYIVYGNGRAYDTNNPLNSWLGESKKLYQSRIINEIESVTFESSGPIEIIGFNLDNNENNNVWEAELLDNSLTSISCKYPSVLMCFNGNIEINDSLLNKYNFAYLQKDTEYRLNFGRFCEAGLYKLIS